MASACPRSDTGARRRIARAAREGAEAGGPGGELRSRFRDVWRLPAKADEEEPA